jgi:hypothetical protein
MKIQIYLFIFIFSLCSEVLCNHYIEYKLLANGEIGDSTVSIEAQMYIGPPSVDLNSIKKPRLRFAAYLNTLYVKPNYFVVDNQMIYYGNKGSGVGFMIDDGSFFFDTTILDLQNYLGYLHGENYWLHRSILENFARKALFRMDTFSHFSFASIASQQLDVYEVFHNDQLLNQHVEEKANYYKVVHEYRGDSDHSQSVTLYDKTDFNILQSNGVIKTNTFGKNVRLVYVLEREIFHERDNYLKNAVHGMAYPFGYILANQLRVKNPNFSLEEVYNRLNDLYLQNFNEISPEDVQSYIANDWIKEEVERMPEAAKKQQEIYHSALQILESSLTKEAVEPDVFEQAEHFAKHMPKQQIQTLYNQAAKIHNAMDFYTYEYNPSLVFDIVVWKFAKTILSSDEYTQARWRHILREKLEMALQKEFADIKKKRWRKKATIPKKQAKLMPWLFSDSC